MNIIYVSYLFDALLTASLIFLISAGLNVIFGVLRILNLAHGSLFLLGAYVSVTLFGLLSGYMDIYLLSVLIPLLTAGIVGGFGMFLELVLRSTYRLLEEYQLLFTFGLILVLADAMKIIWGVQPLGVGRVFAAYGSLEPTGIPYPVYPLIVQAFALTVGIALWAFLNRTRTGVIVRAVASDKEISNTLGINVKRTYLTTFALGSALAGLAGAVIVPIIPAFPGGDIEVVILAFVAVVAGGLGSIKGALVGSLVIGSIRSISLAVFPELELFLIYLFMAVILIFRPQGLFGVAER